MLICAVFYQCHLFVELLSEYLRGDTRMYLLFFFPLYVNKDKIAGTLSKDPFEFQLKCDYLMRIEYLELPVFFFNI